MMLDPLIHWMANVGQGTWSSFKRAASTLLEPQAEVADQIRRLRFRFSDLGLAEFFIGGSDRWRAFQPVLASSRSGPDWAFLCGARTARIAETVASEARRLGCQSFRLTVDGLFTVVKVHGNRLPEIAAAAGIPFESDIGRLLAAELPALASVLKTAHRRPPPRNWTVRSFDLRTARWTDDDCGETVREYTSAYDERIYLLTTDAGDPLELPKREAIFAAAARKNHRLALYDARNRQLSTPMTAPLPEAYARAACVATGRSSELVGDRIVYQQVSPELAAVLLVALEHPPPRFETCSGRPSRRRR